jgi:TRAP-type mannitol/chloroaromatic compound transport system substrate-binding protein
MGGFFRKEIKTPADFKGLKMRIGGTGGLPLQKLGRRAAADSWRRHLSRAREGNDRRGRMGRPVRRRESSVLYKVAKNYYYPGWWEGGPELDLYVNIKAFRAAEELSGHSRGRVLRGERRHAGEVRRAESGRAQAAARRRREAAAVSSNEIMAACFKATNEVYDEIATKNAKFKKTTSRGRRSATNRCRGSRSRKTASTTS